MSGEVDDKIVSMRFDNTSFENKLGDTIKSLDKLRQSLDLAGAAKGLEDVGRAGKNFDLSGMAGALEGMSGKFLALSAVGIQVLGNLATKAVTAGAQMLKSLTLDPILSGFSEYETNLNSIQTILANTKADGSTLDDVNSALDELNTYADKTIYNFSEMARNIGTFTAAGVNLKDSVNAIKGIANLAAISGSNSQQASTAMYQLSQALAAGKVNLMDWNSVVNAGMGGEIFKKALFETGKAMKTITDVPLTASFEEWEKKGGTFREQMEKGWLTADVLKTTLGAFSGELDQASLMAQGFSASAARSMIDLGKTGLEAATQVKTFSQLMDTTKEAVGSGWSTTFKILVGNFNEAKTLFTSLAGTIGGFVGKSADARNELLQGWKNAGGRDLLVQSLVTGFKALGDILKQVSSAFREFFPKTTVDDLVHFTQRFAELMKSLQAGNDTLDKIKNIFRGVFAALSIGFEVIKGVASVIGDLFSAFSGGGGALLNFGSSAGLTIVKLQEMLVQGGAIRDFFDRIGAYVQKAVGFILDFKDSITNLFSGFSGGEAVEGAADRVSSRFEHLTGVAKAVAEAWERLGERLTGVKEILSTVGDYISNWFKELGGRLADAFQPGDFNAALDAVNVGLLGGIALMIKKFMSGGINLNFGNNLLEKISGTFDQLTSTLKTMQADIKSKVILRIAAAVAVLVASITVLSLIDSAALTKALVALTVGFGQLLGAMALMDKIGTGSSAAKMTVLATGMILLSTAVLILSAAVKTLSSMSWGELTKGLTGVAALMATLAATAQVLDGSSGGLVRAGIAMSAMAVGLLLLSTAMKVFATMSWAEMAKGLVGVAGGLALMSGAMNLMPTGMLGTSVGLIAMATGLLILSKATQSFATMSWAEMAKGMVGIGAGLLIIAGAMRLMPNMLVTSVGLMGVAVALNVLALAVRSMGSMDFMTMAKGIGGLGAMLLILAGAMLIMEGTLGGAAALIVASGALVVLSGVLITLGQLKISELAMALGALVGVFVILGVAALALGAATPVLMALGGSMLLIGAGVGTLGLGLMFIAKAFEIMAKSGAAGAKAIVEIIKTFVAARADIVKAFADSIIDLAATLLKAVPLLLRLFEAILIQMAETVIKAVPAITKAFITIVTSALKAMRTLVPDLIETGWVLLQAFLQGFATHIADIVAAGVKIITQLATALITAMPQLVTTAVTLIVAFIGELANHAAELVKAGLELLTSFISGLSDNLYKVTGAVADLIITFLAEIAISEMKIVEAGVNIMLWFLRGIADNINKLVDGVGDIVIAFVTKLGDETNQFINAGFKVLTDFLQGIGDNLIEVANTVGDVIASFLFALGNNMQKIIDAGANLIVQFLDGIAKNLQKIIDSGTNLIIKFIEGIGKAALDIAKAAMDTVVKFAEGLDTAIRDGRVVERLTKAGVDIAGAIGEGMIKGLGASEMIKKVVDAAVNLAKKAYEAAKEWLHINSPSKRFMVLGASMGEGMSVGLDNDSSATNSAVMAAERIVKAFSETLEKAKDPMLSIGDISPTITPVLDLSSVRAGARQLDSMMRVSAIVPEVSIGSAREIATTAELTNEPDPAPATYAGPAEVTFTQINNSPQALTTADIYRNTKSQIALAKEELNL